MIKYFFTLSLVFTYFSVKSQITKGYWLVGGTASFSKEKTSGIGSIQNTSTYFFANAGVGYFPINKLATGLRPSFTYNKASFSVNEYYSLGLSPFVRYYFLKPEKDINLFLETDYTLEKFIRKENGVNDASNGSSFSFMGGPVIFFNSSVSLEFSFGYLLHFTPNNGKDYTKTQLKIGFQYHLTK